MGFNVIPWGSGWWWDDYSIPNMMGKIKAMFQTTNQGYIYTPIYIYTHQYDVWMWKMEGLQKWQVTHPCCRKCLVFFATGLPASACETVPGLVTASSLWWLRTVGNLGGHPSQVRLCLKIGCPSNPMMFFNMYEFLRTTHPTDYSLVETLKHINWDHHSKVRSWPVLDTQVVS